LDQGAKQDVKARIRERYKGGDTENMDVIPARPKESIFDETSRKRVCAYCRVSTDDPRQTSSYELQKNHYEEFIREHPGWELAGIYADEGITGTSMEKRDEFNRMIADCRTGKADLIVCKSVARFARNVVDSIMTVRMLLELRPPVGVFFEAEHMSTLDSSSEMMLSLLSMTAQEESHNKSEIMNISIEQRFKRGVLLTPPLLGYDWDDSHRLTVNVQEAATVRLAYAMLLAGFAKKEIAGRLNGLGQPSKLGNVSWNAGAVAGLLRNERYCGDVLARKTFTPNYLTHRSRKNRMDRNQYLWHRQHEPIVSPEMWHAAQTMLNVCRNGGGAPVLTVIGEGVLRGFVPVNLRHVWNDPDAYVKASLRAYGEEFAGNNGGQDGSEEPDDPNIPPTAGYQVVRAGFFPDRCPAVTLSRGTARFSGACYRRLRETECVELLLNPVERLLAIRPCCADAPNAIRWMHAREGRNETRGIGAAVFAGMLMDLMGWNKDYRYCIRGYARENEGALAMFFDLYEPEARIRLAGEGGGVKELKGYPAEWAGRFGPHAFEQLNGGRLPDGSPRGLDAEVRMAEINELPKVTHDDVAAIEREIGSIQNTAVLSSKKEGIKQAECEAAQKQTGYLPL
jgi:site-specific DNA recombinase